MKKLFIFITLVLTYPVFAACPIEGDGSACIAEFQSFSMRNQSDITSIKPPQALNSRRFIETPNTEQNINKTERKDSRRDFGPQNSDYSYNANCQFGNCRQSGTPTNVSAEN